MKALYKRMLYNLSWLFLCHPIQAACKPTPLPSLDCVRSLSAKEEERLKLDCRFVNSGVDDVFLFADNLSLEGPIGKDSPYLYVLAGWERKENVLQYNLASANTLDLPSLIHPLAHLTLSDLGRLVLIRRGTAQTVIIYWQLPPGSKYPSQGNWLARVKLIYLDAREASRLLQPGVLSDSCRLKLRDGLLRAAIPRKVSLEAKHLTEAKGWSYDGCRDVISEKFQHLFSKTLTLRIRKITSR